MKRAASLFVGLFAVAALAQTQPTVIRSGRLPTDHAGQDVQARSAVLSATATNNAVNVVQSARVCLDYPACTVYAAYNGTAFAIVGAELDVPNGFTDSQKVNPDTMITPHSVVSQAASGQRAFGVAHDGARVYIGTESGAYFYSSAGTIYSASAMDVATISIDTLGLKTSANGYIQMFYPQPVPLGSLQACTSARKGVLQTLSTDGRTYVCDGTTNQMVAYTLSATATIDFASMNTQTTDSKTVTITGALTSDWVHCAPVSGGDMQGTDMHSTVTSANTVTILAHNDTSGTIDPASMSIKCVIIR